MEQYIERPEVIKSQLCYYESGAIGVYCAIDGASPTMTNHFAAVTYKVLDGSGIIATPRTMVAVEHGDEVTVPRAEPYAYAGRMSLLSRADPGFHPDFVTLDGQSLGRAQRQKMRKMNRTILKATIWSDTEKTLTDWFGPRESHLAFLSSMQDR